MKLFGRRRRREEKRAISFQNVWGTGADVLNGDGIDRALGLIPVYSATRLIADSIASLPLQGFREAGSTSEKMSTPPALLRDPTLFGTEYDWIFRALTSLMLRGNAYGLITQTDGMGFPTQIEWLHPDEVTVHDDRAVQRPTFFWLGTPIPPSDLIHIPAYTLPGRVLGLSPIKAFALQIDTGLLAQTFGRDFFRSGGHPSALLKHPKPTDQDGAKRIRDRFLQAVNGRGPAVMAGGWEYEAIQVAPEESQFIQTLKLNATQVAAIYGIYPPERIGGESGSSKTYANVESDSIAFVQMTLRPWLVRLEKAISGVLPERQVVRFNVDALIRADLSTRYLAHTESLVAGWKSVDDVRELENMPPLPDGAGGKYLWPPRRQQLTNVELGLGADDESGQHDPQEVVELEQSAEPAEPAESDDSSEEPFEDD